MSTLNRDDMSKYWREWRKVNLDMDSYIVATNVTATTLPNLLTRYVVGSGGQGQDRTSGSDSSTQRNRRRNHFPLLLVDTEGYDCDILMGLPFKDSDHTHDRQQEQISNIPLRTSPSSLSLTSAAMEALPIQIVPDMILFEHRWCPAEKRTTVNSYLRSSMNGASSSDATAQQRPRYNLTVPRKSANTIAARVRTIDRPGWP